VGAAVLVLLLGAYAVRSILAMHARASGTYNALFPARNAIDGDVTTEWLMPDREQQGWLEVTFRKRTVREVHILNAHAPPSDDRAIHDFTLSCTDREHPVKSIRASIEFSATPQWHTYEFGGARCDAVRIDVTSVHRNGGGIAEIEIP